MPGHVRVSGAWNELVQPASRVSGAWQDTVEGYLRTGGAWQTWFTQSYSATLTIGSAVIGKVTYYGYDVSGANGNLTTNSAFGSLSNTTFNGATIREVYWQASTTTLVLTFATDVGAGFVSTMNITGYGGGSATYLDQGSYAQYTASLSSVPPASGNVTLELT